MNVLITYGDEQVLVPKKVAEFLEKDRKKMAALAKQDQRHLSKSSFETVPDSQYFAERYDLEDHVFKNLSLEKLRSGIAELSEEEKLLLSYRFKSDMNLEEIGKRFGVSKMAMSKRLKKLITKLRDSIS